jgi:hypothetical protein
VRAGEASGTAGALGAGPQVLWGRQEKEKPPPKRAAFEFTAAAAASASVHRLAAGNEQCWRQQLYGAAHGILGCKKKS